MMGKTLALSLALLAAGAAWADGVDWARKDSGGTPVVGGRGSDGAPLYVCRATLADGTVAVGRFATVGAGAGECRAALQGSERAFVDFDVLVHVANPEVATRWVPGHATGFPQRSVIAAQTQEGRQWLVCSALHLADGSMQPGYLFDENCVYALGGRQLSSENYLVLGSNDPGAATTVDAQPSLEGFDPAGMLEVKAIAAFCALAADSCAAELPALPEPTAAN